MIDSMFQEGTDSTLDDQVRRPAAPPPAASAFSLLGLGAAPFRGIGGGVAKSMAFGSEIVGAFGQVAGGAEASAGGMFSTQSEQEKRQADAARERLARGGPDMSNPVGDAFRQRAADIMPDPKTAHTSEQVVAGLFDFGTRAIGYAVTTGPAAPFLLGGDVALEESDRLKQQGVDLGTRTQAGAVAGTLAGVSVAVPLTGATAATRFAKGAAVGEGAIVGQSLAEREILRAAGYDKLADSFDPLDPVALAMGVVPGVLGAKFGHAAPKPLPKLRTEADVRAAAKLSPAEQAHENAYERSATNLAELERAIAAEKRPEVRALLETELAKQRTAARESAVEAALQHEPDLEPAARVGQVAEALDSSRLTPDADLAGRDAHVSAVELAADQMGRGERVEVGSVVQAPDYVDMYHGSPHEFAAFDSARIGTGEGAQAFGHGLYLAESEGVARFYRDSLSRPQDAGAVDHPPGFIYKVQAPREMVGRMIDLEAPIERAPQAVQDYYRRQGAYKPGQPLTEHMAIDQFASAEFSKAGIPGISYLDATARAAGDGTRNYVVFPGHEGHLRIMERNGKTLHNTAAAADQLRALREPPEPKTPRAEPATPKPSADAASRPETKPQPAAPAEPGQSAIARAAADAEALNPDMLVQLEGMDAPMRVGDLMERVREEAKQDTLSGKLLEVAAACDLTG